MRPDKDKRPLHAARHAASGHSDTKESGREAKKAAGGAKKEKDSGASDGEWYLGPKHYIDWDRLRPVFRVAMVLLFAAGVVAFWPRRPQSVIGTIAASSEKTTRRPVRMEEFSEPVLVPATPRPTSDIDLSANSALLAQAQAAVDDAEAAVNKITAEQEKELVAAESSDSKVTVYDSAEDYFGSDDVFLTFYDILEDVEVTPAPTYIATPAPTAAPESPDASVGTGETVVVTPPPADTPAPAAPSGVVLQGTPGAACVNAYNNWDASLKQYAYDTAKAYGISYELVLAIIYHESRFNAGATHLNTNGTTDWGLMQINDVCFSLLHSQLGISGMSDLLDPYKAIQAGCAILAYHMRYTGNEDDALLRYQVGAGAYKYYKANGTTPAAYGSTLSMKQSYVAAGI